LIKVLAAAFIFTLLIELGARTMIHRFRKTFRWIIISEDISPALTAKKVTNYIGRSFDPELGWIRKPYAKGIDATRIGTTGFRINARGCRHNPGFEQHESSIAVFGDSYVFCRLVNDNETWPHFLSEITGTNVLNFGVGNYGVDQALLRLEREFGCLESRIVIIGFVPETMARIHSYWKHYFEYGNLLAFKPRFVIEDGKLTKHFPVVSSFSEFMAYREKLDTIQNLDYWYLRKFKRDLLRFPYSYYCLVRWRRYFPILWCLSVARLVANDEKWSRRAFEEVLRDNSRHTAQLYQDPHAKALLKALLNRANQVCASGGKQTLIITVPQPVDIERAKRGVRDYGEFFKSITTEIPVLDMTERFMNHPNPKALYIDGKLGPHTSAEANLLIAQAVNEKLSSMGWLPVASTR
jgi:hypothetical protein